MARSPRAQVYKRQDGEWGWRRYSANNNITASSDEGYKGPAAAEAAARRENPGLPIEREMVVTLRPVWSATASSLWAFSVVVPAKV